jgi:penicillin-binding protein 2
MKRNQLHTDGDPQKRELIKKRHFSLRINLFFFITFVLFSILLVRLAILQFVEGKELVAAKNKLLYRDTQIAPIRGNIYDKDSFPLAYTVSVQSLFFRVEAGQSKMQDEVIALAYELEKIFKEKGNPGSDMPTAEEIILSMDVGYDLNKNKTKDPGSIWIPRRIKADLSKEEIAYIMERRDEFKWLEVSEESIRTYSTEDDGTAIATQLIGYMRPFSVGKETKSGLDKYKDPALAEEYLPEEFVGYDGLEFMYQDELRGKSGTKKYPVNAGDRIIGKPEITPPEKGHNLYLTIQKDVQSITEKAIMDHLAFMRSGKSGNKYYNNPNAHTGYAVAMEVKTGKIISMASMPDYDTNIWIPYISGKDYNEILPIINNGTIRTAFPKLPPEQRTKRMSSMVYMGSVIKPLTILMGLNEGFITPTTKYNDTGSFSYGMVGRQATIRNSGGKVNGMIGPADAIRVSSNTYMAAMVGEPLSKRDAKKSVQVLDEYYNKFGLGVVTGSGLPYEDDGISEYQTLAESEGSLSAMVRASWGQNQKYTTMQLAQYAATLASKGKRMQPQFVEKITTYEGETLQTFEPVVLDDTKFPDQYWDVIEQGMIGVNKQGFEGVNYSVAAKTGTSTQLLNGKEVDNAVFIAYAPVEDPTLAVAVVVPEGGYGSYGAAPIARQMFDAYDQYIGLNGVPKGAPPVEEVPASGTVNSNASTGNQSVPPATNTNNNSNSNANSNANTGNNPKPSPSANPNPASGTNDQTNVPADQAVVPQTRQEEDETTNGGTEP